MKYVCAYCHGYADVIYILLMIRHSTAGEFPNLPGGYRQTVCVYVLRVQHGDLSFSLRLCDGEAVQNYPHARVALYLLSKTVS